jgi:hypothetical protein
VLWSSGRCRSAGGGERSDACERADEVGLPGTAGGEVKRPAAAGVGQRPGSASSLRRTVRAARTVVAGRPITAVPAQQVVRETRDDGPGGVGGKLAGGEVRQRLVLEVADRQLDDGVLAVLGLDQFERLGAVGEEGEQLPSWAAVRLGR